ncbi:MAG TPA: hypothetical protein VMH06_05655 [Thermodesulfovibrionales bacterium]|nr:hypothetical protein [Thermodesulfovibrionales bacterium]
MKTFFLVLAAAAALVLQTTVTFYGLSPALTTLVAYYVGISSGAAKGTLFGSLLGMVEDSISGGMIGPNLLGKGMVGLFSSFLSGGPFRWSPLLGTLALFILTVLEGVLVFIVKGVYEALPAPPARAALILALQGALNACAGVLIKPGGAESHD